MVASSAAMRLKREDYNYTKHDSVFSSWKILVGATDWKDYSEGKEGAERYRVHNLPKIPGPGLYELGIAMAHTSSGRETAKLDSDQIVVVYIGQADNVRTRLQRYGRSGAHLGSGSSYDLSDSVATPTKPGPGLFEEIFSRHFPIVYRWASMKSKSDALMTESRLLETFDYAWNTTGNGTRRRAEILYKLEKNPSRTIKLSSIAKKLLLPFTQNKAVGIKIETSKPISPTDEAHTFLSRVFKVSRSQPKLVVNNANFNEANTVICGIATENGIICELSPVKGRKRCEEHKGMKINRSSLKAENVNPSVAVKFSNVESFGLICGVVSTDGSQCTMPPVQGRKRCEEHKGRRIHRSVSIGKESN